MYFSDRTLCCAFINAKQQCHDTCSGQPCENTCEARSVSRLSIFSDQGPFMGASNIANLKIISMLSAYVLDNIIMTSEPQVRGRVSVWVLDLWRGQ